jgi:hypothetical protein
MNTLLYDKFILDDKYKTIKEDGGNELYELMLVYIKNIKDENLNKSVLEEIQNWLRIGRSSFFLLAVNLIGDLKLHQFENELTRLRLEIIKKHIPDIPENYVEFIEDSIKRINQK